MVSMSLEELLNREVCDIELILLTIECLRREGKGQNMKNILKHCLKAYKWKDPRTNLALKLAYEKGRIIEISFKGKTVYRIPPFKAPPVSLVKAKTRSDQSKIKGNPTAFECNSNETVNNKHRITKHDSKTSSSVTASNKSNLKKLNSNNQPKMVDITVSNEDLSIKETKCGDQTKIDPKGKSGQQVTNRDPKTLESTVVINIEINNNDEPIVDATTIKGDSSILYETISNDKSKLVHNAKTLESDSKEIKNNDHRMSKHDSNTTQSTVTSNKICLNETKKDHKKRKIHSTTIDEDLSVNEATSCHPSNIETNAKKIESDHKERRKNEPSILKDESDPLEFKTTTCNSDLGEIDTNDLPVKVDALKLLSMLEDNDRHLKDMKTNNRQWKRNIIALLVKLYENENIHQHFEINNEGFRGERSESQSSSTSVDVILRRNFKTLQSMLETNNGNTFSHLPVDNNLASNEDMIKLFQQRTVWLESQLKEKNEVIGLLMRMIGPID